MRIFKYVREISNDSLLFNIERTYDTMYQEKIIYIDGEETNYTVTSDGRVFNRTTGRELKGTISSREYRNVQLNVNGGYKNFLVHRLVAQAFCDNPNNLPIVDHIDRNKLNNNYTNLRWSTYSDNALNCEKTVPTACEKIQDLDTYNLRPLLINDNYLACDEGFIVNKKTQKRLRGTERNGYNRVEINGKYQSTHRLIWEAFNGEIPEGMVIDHIDGCHNNNALNNLRLATQAENMKYAYENGHKGQVAIKQYSMDGEFIAEYTSIRAAANAIGGNEIAIRQALDRHGSSAGFLWLRSVGDISVEELLKVSPAKRIKKGSIGVTQYSLDGIKVEHFGSIRAAAENIGCGNSTISRAANAYRAGKGFYWILDNQDITIEELLNKNKLP